MSVGGLTLACALLQAEVTVTGKVIGRRPVNDLDATGSMIDSRGS
jgi:hypothetical protein